MCNEIIAVCSQIHTKHINTQYWKKAEHFTQTLCHIHVLSWKFSNFQNSPQLLRPSGERKGILYIIEFDELRHENRIALSCLDIILCFFMWSHVWRVWRFSLDKKMSVFHEQRICMKIGKSVIESLEMLKIAFGEEAMCRTQNYEWWKRFKEGRNSVDDDPRSGRPSTSKTENNVANFVKSSVHIVVWQFER